MNKPARGAHRSRPTALPDVANKISGLSQAEKFPTSVLQ
jgi:hypothetical protein